MPRISPRAGVNLIIVRENTEGLYAGREHSEGSDGETAIAERVVTRPASLRIGRQAVALARLTGRQRLTIVHKANILPLTDGLFRDSVRQSVQEDAWARQALAVDERLVDTAAYQLASAPEQFDMIVTTNLFGDILSDLAAHWCGGLGMAPSLNWGDGIAIAEPVHGSAPDIAGLGRANPIGAILSGALLARHVWCLPEAAASIEQAVRTALSEDLPVLDGRLAPGCSTKQVTAAVLERLG